LYSSFLVRSTEYYSIEHIENNEKTRAFVLGTSRAAVSLLKTTLIGTLAFSLGTISDIEAIKSFCSVGVCATVFNFMNSMLFFMPCLYYDFKRVFDNKNDCCTLCSCNPEGVIFCGGRCVLDDYANRKEPFFDALLINKVAPML